MSRHKPIRFREPNIPEYAKEKLKSFIAQHPVTYSASKVIMALVISGGVLTTAVAFPGLFHMIGKASLKREREQRERYRRLWENFHRMKKENVVRFVGEEDGQLIYEFTKQGMSRVRKFLVETLEFAKPAAWDGVWRVIIFDIPESRKAARAAFQRKIAELGCYRLQKSVWVYPFACEEEITFLVDFFQVKPFVHLFHTSEMPSGRTLYHFKDAIKEVAYCE